MTSTTNAALTDPTFTVPSMPDASDGIAWLRANVVRFSSATEHARRRRMTTDLLAAVDPVMLRERARRSSADQPFEAVVVEVLADALGVAVSTEDVTTVAHAYQPQLSTGPDVDDAVARLVADCGGGWSESTAARIGLLVQACVATAGLIEHASRRTGDADTAVAEALRHDPPVPVTRRRDPSGTLVEVPLAGLPFGAGAHACPGREHAVAIACGVLEGTATAREPR